ncbi:MAG: hypothetical protein IKG04_05120 [Exiguobacterium sp.]|nr:hypothetical protein [Exiguobacterium sp.]
MSTFTPNYNLEKPEASDPFENFRQSYNNNMDTIDENLGGGGSGGHTIYDKDGNALAQESGLQFTGNVSVSDDSGNGRTVVDILGGGGNVYGAFIDPSRILVNSAYTSNLSYTATEDCFIYTAVALNSNTGGSCAIDGQNIASWWNGSGGTVAEAIGSYLKKGQTFTATATNASSSGYMVYGLTQGTNGIFAPVIYSDNERVIGVWRDNKPLYQKTVDCGLVTADSNWHSIAHGVSDMDDCVGMEAICIKTGTTDIVNGYRPALNLGIALERNGANLQYMNTWFGTGDRRLIVTLRYTKTTDVAGSGNWNTDGVPTVHYDTNEQVIGTWLGKPLYQKVFTGLSVVLGIDWVNAIDISSLAMEDCIFCIGIVPNTYQTPLCTRINGNYLQAYMNRMGGVTITTIVIQYTKTTD